MSGYSATKAAQAGFAESLRAEFAATDIHVSVVYPVSTDTEFREAMERDYGHSVSGLGPKQPVEHVAAAIVQCIRRPRAEVYPHSKSRALAMLNAVAPAFADRLVQRYGRKRTVGRRNSSHPMRDRLRRELTVGDPAANVDGPELPDVALAIAKAVREAGGRALVVGGWVRDRLLGRTLEGRRPRGLRPRVPARCARCSRRSAR